MISLRPNDLDPTSLIPNGIRALIDYECLLCKKNIKKGESHEHDRLNHTPNRSRRYNPKHKCEKHGW